MPPLNKNNSAVKRIMQEARELANDPCTDYSAAPLEDDIFEWHCTLRGPSGTEFEGGLYHFRILLPAEYPFRPPSIMMLTPNGRFELNTKICISFTNYHEELWQPAWGVRTAIIGLQGFFPLKGQAAIGVGSIEYPAAERKRLAGLSRNWECPVCKQCNLESLPDPTAPADCDKMEVNVNPSDSSIPPRNLRLATSDDHDDEKQIVQPDPGTNTSVHQAVTTPVNISSPMADRRPLVADADHSSSETSERSSTPVPSPRRSSQKPPVLLDTAICILLVLLFAIICRRIV